MKLLVLSSAALLLAAQGAIAGQPAPMQVAQAASTAVGASSTTYVTIAGDDALSSNLVGLSVYNKANQDIGTIKDVAMGPADHAQAYILSVGGFLGMGEHYVAVSPSAVKVMYNDSDKKWHATMDATADQLKTAPEFKYTGRWNASRT